MAGTVRRHGGTLRPMQLNTHYSNHMARQKSCGKSPSSWPGLHDTIPSGKDTSKPARSTKKSRSTTATAQYTQVSATAEYTHSTLLKSSNRPMAAARRRQGQQLYAWYGTPSRRPQAAPPFPLTPAGEVIQPQPPALPPEAWPCECNTNKAKQPKRDKVFLNTTHC